MVVLPEIQRGQVIKSVHDDVHFGVAATQRILKLEAWWLRHVEDYVKDAQNAQNSGISSKRKTCVAPRNRTVEQSTHGSCLCQ